ncbi:peroxisome assembly protein 12-like [Eriocheir sinensis]|uniref:peroxisome assembly protein 12-like n=1 Tax=Eriocheir sinensis TaxID=95602 RepID=UPI0021C8E089|nr:peroxisome assembly protein 12-like [Eriocheir sinensis]
MAEFGAHITITARDRPSIFDVVAQDSLMATLNPAVKHVLKVLAESNPERRGWCLRYSNEIFMIFNLVIQHHYLSNYGSSFAENFYDLKRVEVTSKKNKNPLTLSKEGYMKSLFALVAFPFIHTLLDQTYQELREHEDSDTSNNQGWKARIRKLFSKSWPVVHLSWELLTVIFYVRYVIGRNKFHNPLLYICGIHLATLSKDDYEIIDARGEQLLSFKRVRSLQEFSQWAMERLGSTLMNSLEVGAFFLQFLEWFYTSNVTPRSILVQPIPQPPQVTGMKVSGLNSTDCPICFKKRKQETALSVSGYVFCYSCILQHLRKEQKCPVTGYPASPAQLIRIYQAM